MTRPGTDRGPFVSVVTAFYNSAETLGDSIESVLGQSHTEFEYIVVDNRSTDGGYALAAEYAKIDSRIRLMQNAAHLEQLPNYNAALRLVSPQARYVKMVQADDLLLEGCLERMVAVGEANPSTSVISSYYLKGRDLMGAGLPLSMCVIPGREACRMHLLDGRYLFGSPSTVMYRADLVRGRDPFFAESSRLSDTELCYEELENADLGFVHQVLSFLRVADDSIQSALSKYNWELLGFYMLLCRYGPRLLSAAELSARIRAVRSVYLRYLAESWVAGQDRRFWQEHERGLEAIGQRLPRFPELAPHILATIARALLHPKTTWSRHRVHRSR